jgi:hypothetical protein
MPSYAIGLGISPALLIAAPDGTPQTALLLETGLPLLLENGDYLTQG